MGMGFIFSSDTLGFLIIETGILRKIWLGNGIETPSPPSPSGPSTFLFELFSSNNSYSSFVAILLNNFFRTSGVFVFYPQLHFVIMGDQG